MFVLAEVIPPNFLELLTKESISILKKITLKEQVTGAYILKQ